MEILRVPSSSVVATIEVTDPNTEYSVSVKDLSDDSQSIVTIMSESSAKLQVALPSNYDGEYSIVVDGEETLVSVVRPYVDPTKMGKTASEISEYTKHEELARAIIDSIVIEGFYYKKQLLQMTGLGADYLPLWTDAKKLLKLYENNVKVYDSGEESDSEVSYGLSEDKTSITIFYNGGINKSEGAPNILPLAQSDLIDMIFGYRGFPKTYDYVAIVEAGYKKLPSDVVRAAELLIDDIACGRLDYYKRYVADYNTDQFKIKFDKAVFEGTGNILVDKILSKYAKSIRRVGVL
jgi:hypothetical protein